jgi:hypothetical protein
MYIVKVSHDHALLVQLCNNLNAHVASCDHLIISNDKDTTQKQMKSYMSMTL